MINKKTFVAAAFGLCLVAGGALMLHAADAPAPKAYVIAEIDVKDTESYKTYAAQVPAIIAKHGGTYLARGGQTVPYEGTAPASRVVIVEFANLKAARAFYESAEYQAAAQIRKKAATGRMFILEGLAR